MYLRRHGDIAYIGCRGGIEFDRALDACIVEKVKVRGVLHHFYPAWNVFFCIVTRGKRAMVYNSVDRDRQEIFAGACECIDLCLERRKSPFVLCDQLPIEIDFGGMCHGAKAKYDSLREEMIRDDDLPFVPDPANVIAERRPLIQVVV